MRLPRLPFAPSRRSLLDDLAQPGLHEGQIATMFGGRMAPGPGQKMDCRLTVMAFTNRSGSNLLADYLVQTGRFGCFGEVLNPPVVTAFRERKGSDSLPCYLAELAEAHKCGLGRDLGVKASSDQLAMLVRHGIPRMFTGFRVIHIWRQDLIGQAVSFAIASRTRRWTSRQQAPLQSLDDMAPDPDMADIEEMMRAIQMHNNRISALVSLLDLPVASVSYEELTDTPGQAVRRICRALKVDLGDWRPKAPQIEKQANDLNDRFVAACRHRAQARLVH